MHPKIQTFKTQIRRRQKQQLLHQLRIKLHYNNDDPLNIKPIQQFNKQWQSYLQKPTSLVPYQVIKYFSSVKVQVKVVQDIVNLLLDVCDVFNMVFVSLCLQTYQLNTTPYFTKLSKHLQQNYHIGQLRNIQKQQQNKGQNQNTNWLINIDLDGIKCIEEVYLNYFVKYFNRLTSGEDVKVDFVNVWKQYFVRYWDQRVDGGDVNVRICAEVAQRLLHFQTIIPDLPPLLKTISSCLLQHKTCHPQPYYFIKLYICHSYPPTPIPSLLLSPRFPEFILNGLSYECCIKPTLLILQKIFEQPQILKFIENQFFIVRMLDAMIRMYNQTYNRKVKVDLMSGLYNIMFSEIRFVRDWVLGVDFSQLMHNTMGAGVQDVIDFGLAALFNYPSLDICLKLLYSPKFKLLEQSNNLLFNKPKQKTWQYSQDLLQTLQSILPLLHTQSCENPNQQLYQLLDHIIRELEITILKLSEAEWDGNFYQKQEIVNGFEYIVRTCEELRQKNIEGCRQKGQQSERQRCGDGNEPRYK